MKYAKLTKPRTDAQRLLDAQLWCAGAAPHMVAGKTAEEVCAAWGVVQEKNRRKVAEALVKRQLALS